MTDPAQVRVVTLTNRELEDLLRRVVASALDGFDRRRSTPATMLSPRQVARRAKIRDERVYQAITDGRLNAVRDKGGRFHVSLADADTWITSLAKYGY